MGRTIIVGDLHGCLDELSELLDVVRFSVSDRLVSVGDTIVRGPMPAQTVALLRSLGARAVRGNHEDRVLRWLDSHADGEGEAPEPKKGAEVPGEMTRAAARALSAEDRAWLRALPLWLDLAEHGVRVVHAGVLPGVAIERTAPEVLMSIRCLGKNGKPVMKREGPVWAKSYKGPPHVVFGHNAQVEPQVHAWATGIDTGCVYGGRLTALVLEEGQAPPQKRHRAEVLVSVPARRAYVPVRAG
ncbi:MAG: metallophosphoesterase [Polyangiaceae bacterium]